HGTSKRCSSGHVRRTRMSMRSPSTRVRPAIRIPTAIQPRTPTDDSSMTEPAVRLSSAAWDAAVRVLSTARNATLVCHVAPDGDALGSMLALARCLRARGVDVTCTWGDDRWQVPPSYRWLPDIDTLVPPTDVPHRPELMVVLDTASQARLGVLA